MADESSPPRIRVLIVAGYATVRAGLHALLADIPELAVVDGIDGGVDELRRVLRGRDPDVLLLDTSGDRDSGTVLRRTLTALEEADRGTALVVLGDRPEDELIPLADAPLPGWGYLLRAEADAPQIAGAVRAAAVGLTVLDRSIPFPSENEAALPDARPVPPDPADLPPGEALTPREIEVLQQMAEGLPNKIIATRLGISLHTVKFHVAQILGKLGATSRTEAVTLGARRGYIVF
jgi:Response regulator containing a CheY-like receiver domain and an HTH DNA-binding domain